MALSILADRDRYNKTQGRLEHTEGLVKETLKVVRNEHERASVVKSEEERAPIVGERERDDRNKIYAINSKRNIRMEKESGD